jgi:hypothetical protein
MTACRRFFDPVFLNNIGIKLFGFSFSKKKNDSYYNKDRSQNKQNWKKHNAVGLIVNYQQGRWHLVCIPTHQFQLLSKVFFIPKNQP